MAKDNEPVPPEQPKQTPLDPVSLEIEREQQIIRETKRREEAGRCTERCRAHDEWCVETLPKHRFHACERCRTGQDRSTEQVSN
jgi:hypothetical protein